MIPSGRADPVGAAEFAALMARLGPWSRAPRLAIAVSGGADSTALAWLTARWLPAVGAVRGFVVDHGLRPESASEAAEALAILARQGIGGRVLRIRVSPGPGVPARARMARYAALTAACREEGLLHLLLGHHAGDQAETRLMRAERGSLPAGLAGMAAVVEQEDLRLLRPLLGVAPARLRATLRAAGLGWVEDPTNRDLRFLRPRLRRLLAAEDGEGEVARYRAEAAAAAGAARPALEASVAAWLAVRATLRPEGFALLAPAPWDVGALAAVLRIVGGGAHAPGPARVAALAASPGPATLGGVRLLPAGRMGRGFLAVREAAAMAAPMQAAPGAAWDGRFRLSRLVDLAEYQGLELGAVGPAAAALRDVTPLPAAVLRTLPALRRRGEIVAVPHLHHPDGRGCAEWGLRFCPAVPASAAWCAG